MAESIATGLVVICIFLGLILMVLVFILQSLYSLLSTIRKPSDSKDQNPESQ